MSTSLPTSTFDVPTTNASTTARRASAWPAWTREPLLHFVVLGALLFGIDQYVLSQTEDPHTIVVGLEVDNEAKQLFKAQRGQDPSKEELDALRRIWLDNEVLYREGLALEVDKGDTAIRERVIFKALTMIEAGVKLPEIDDKALREWFESRHAKYDEPSRYNFQEAALAGDKSESAVRAFVDALNAGTPGDAQAGLRVFKDRPLSNLVQSYGADFPKELDESPVGQWRALKSRDGWHAMRLDSITPAIPAVYENLRGVLMQDWKDATASEQRTAAVRMLARKYTVKFESEAAAK